MRRAERRRLLRDRAEMEQLAQHPAWAVREPALRYLRMTDPIVYDDPQPPFWLSVRLRLAGVRDAW